jgi:hypothetical protein
MIILVKTTPAASGLKISRTRVAMKKIIKIERIRNPETRPLSSALVESAKKDNIMGYIEPKDVPNKQLITKKNQHREKKLLEYLTKFQR